MAKDVELKHYNPVNYEQFMYGELLSTLVKQNNTIIEQNKTIIEQIEKTVKALTANVEQPAPATKTKSTEKTAKTDTKDSTKE